MDLRPQTMSMGGVAPVGTSVAPSRTLQPSANALKAPPAGAVPGWWSALLAAAAPPPLPARSRSIGAEKGSGSLLGRPLNSPATGLPPPLWAAPATKPCRSAAEVASTSLWVETKEVSSLPACCRKSGARHYQ